MNTADPIATGPTSGSQKETRRSLRSRFRWRRSWRSSTQASPMRLCRTSQAISELATTKARGLLTSYLVSNAIVVLIPWILRISSRRDPRSRAVRR